MILENIHYTRIDHPTYKYRLLTDVVVYVGVFGLNIETEYFHMGKGGILIIRKGYAWDGSSGPTWDTQSTMFASLAHDAGYQMLRESLMITPEQYEFSHADFNIRFEELRLLWDNIYRKLLVEGGAWRVRAWWHWKGVRIWGREHALPEFLR